MEKLLLYVEIHQLKKQGFKIAAIAKKLEISRNTVYKYLNMSFNEASEWVSSTGSRRKKLDTLPGHDYKLAKGTSRSFFCSSGGLVNREDFLQ